MARCMVGEPVRPRHVVLLELDQLLGLVMLSPDPFVPEVVEKT